MLSFRLTKGGEKFGEGVLLTRKWGKYIKAFMVAVIAVVVTGLGCSFCLWHER